MDITEVRSAVDELQKAFAEFKAANEERLKQLGEKGKVDPLLEEKLGKVNARMDELQAEIVQAKRLPQPGGAGGEKALSTEEREHKQAWLAFARKGKDEGLRELEAKAMQVGLDPDGGYLVPADTSGRIVRRIYETSPIRSISTVVTISTDRLEGMADLDEASAGWVGETQDRPETGTPELGKWAIPVHEVYAEPRITQKLLDDAAFDLESWLSGKVADKFTRMENAAFVAGNGVNRPKGFTSYTTAATADGARAWGVLEHVATGVSGDFAASNKGDQLLDLVYRLKQAYRTGAVWVMPRLLQGDIRKFKGSDNNYLWQPGLQAGQPASLLGYPIVEAEDMPAKAASSLSIAFGNFREGYQIVDRIGIRVLRDPYTAKPYVKFYTTKRVGGDVVNFEAIKFLKFTA